MLVCTLLRVIIWSSSSKTDQLVLLQNWGFLSRLPRGRSIRRCRLRGRRRGRRRRGNWGLLRSCRMGGRKRRRRSWLTLLCGLHLKQSTQQALFPSRDRRHDCTVDAETLLFGKRNLLLLVGIWVLVGWVGGWTGCTLPRGFLVGLILSFTATIAGRTSAATCFAAGCHSSFATCLTPRRHLLRRIGVKEDRVSSLLSGRILLRTKSTTV